MPTLRPNGTLGMFQLCKISSVFLTFLPTTTPSSSQMERWSKLLSKSMREFKPWRSRDFRGRSSNLKACLLSSSTLSNPLKAPLRMSCSTDILISNHGCIPGARVLAHVIPSFAENTCMVVVVLTTDTHLSLACLQSKTCNYRESNCQDVLWS